MTPNRTPILTINNVGAGNTANFNVPIGETLHVVNLDLTVKNTALPPALSDIASTIRVKRNGKTIREFLATELDALNTFDSEELRANIDGCTGQIMGVVTPPTIAGSGTGFAVGDTLTLVGTGSTLANIPNASQAKFAVTSVSSGNITGLRVVNPGQYAVIPTAFTYTTSGGGATNTLTPTFAVMTSLAGNLFAAAPLLGSTIPAVGDTATFRIGIYFADPSRSSLSSVNAFALPTKWPKSALQDATLKQNADGTQELNSLAVEIVMPNNASTSLHALKAYVETTEQMGPLVDKNGNLAFPDANGNLIATSGFDNASSQPFTKLVKWYRTQVNYAATGEFEINPDRVGSLQQVALFCQTGDPIGNVRVLANGKEKVNLSKAQIDETHDKRGMNELAIDPLRLDVVFDYTDSPADAMPLDGLTSFKIIPNMTVAGAANKQLNMIRKVYGWPD